VVLFLSPYAYSLTETSETPLEVTYIANEGFLIRAASQAILIDGLFSDPTISFCDVPSATTLERIEKGLDPFDGIVLFLVTHCHRDHFDTFQVAGALRRNRTAKLICPKQAADILRRETADFGNLADQVLEVSAPLGTRADFIVSGIEIQAIRLRHSPSFVTDPSTGARFDKHRDIENLAYLVGIGGRKWLHLGDAWVDQNADFLGSEVHQVDIAFIYYADRSVRSKEVLSCFAQPKRLVLMHLPAGAGQSSPSRSDDLEPYDIIQFSEPLASMKF
jgi:L-ascorbate metabolism protein UlaG (beta-lactamase superfamily)